MSLNNSKIMHQASFDTVLMTSNRRMSRTADTSFACSHQSILSAMDRFVKSVNNMDSTVLVPSKLRDMDIDKISNSTNCGLLRKTSQCKAPAILHNTDLYSFYLMLHEVKNELLWGPSSASSTIATSSLSNFNGSINNLNNLVRSANNSCFGSALNVAKLSKSESSRSSIDTLSTSTVLLANGQSKSRENKHSRQPSDDSLGSIASSASTMDIDSESEADSLLVDRDSSQVSNEHTMHLAVAFKHHLQGLHTILHQLADTADFFCVRYQEEVDGITEK